LTKEKIKQNKGKLLITFILSLIVMLLWWLISSNRINGFDDFIYDIFKNMRNDNLTKVMKFITEFGGIIGLSTICAITTIVLIIKNRKKCGLAILANLVISTIIYSIVKQIFQRTRPPMEEWLISESGFSFPSGHTTNNIAFYGFIIYLLYNKIEDKKVRNIICILIGFIPILVGLSRIYLRVHYPSDVLAGICLGIILVILFVTFIYENPNFKKKR